MYKEKRHLNQLLSVVLVLMLIGICPFLTGSAEAKSSAGENVMVAVPWELVNKCGHQAVSGPCQAYCWAYCRIILDNVSHIYRDYWTGSQATNPSAVGYTSQTTKMTTKQKLLETICNNVDLGRPVVVRVKGSNGAPFHFVVAIGYKTSRDPNNLKESDILILNPASNSIKPRAGANETYTYLDSCTLSTIAAGERSDGCVGNYVCWTTSSGGAAKQEPSIYTVTFNANGGSVFLPNMSVTNGTLYNSLPNPTRDGYTFAGWFTERSDGSQITPTTIVNLKGNQTLYAHWTKIESKPTYSMVSNGVYTLTPKCASGMRLDVQWGETGDGVNVQIYEPNESAAQQWEFKHIGDGYYTITSKISGKVLDVAGGSKTSGTNVQQYKNNGTSAQKWRLQDAGDGYYYIIPQLNTNLCLDVKSGKAENSTNVQVYTANQSNAQKWKLTPAVALCTVTFDATGGTVGRKTMQVPAGSTLDLLPTPTRSGYSFVCWSNTNGGSGLLIKAGDYIVEQDVTLYAWWKEEETQNTGHWGPWSSWTTKSYTASDTRQVETKEVQTVAAHIEYRYGRYVDQTGTHNCWCSKYLEGLSYISGKAKLDYSNWSTTRYSSSGSTWTCGQCNGKHTGVDHVDAQGRPIWKEYRLPGNKPYYWEETRTVGAQYETQYRYRDWIID